MNCEMMLYKLSSLMRVLLHIITHDTFSSMRKVIVQYHFTVCGCYFSLIKKWQEQNKLQGGKTKRK